MTHGFRSYSDVLVDNKVHIYFSPIYYYCHNNSVLNYYLHLLPVQLHLYFFLFSRLSCVVSKCKTFLIKSNNIRNRGIDNENHEKKEAM